MNEMARLFLPLASILDADKNKSTEELFGPPTDEPSANDLGDEPDPFAVDFYV